MSNVLLFLTDDPVFTLSSDGNLYLENDVFEGLVYESNGSYYLDEGFTQTINVHVEQQGIVIIIAKRCNNRRRGGRKTYSCSEKEFYDYKIRNC